MNQEDLSNITDQELLAKAKKMKSASILSALVIGIMIGVVIYSVLKNSVGFFTLIPLYFIYRIANGAKNNDALKTVLEERGLK